eukprot:scaffold22224_cov20-Tisochrysis_lutea.AAC.1
MPRCALVRLLLLLLPSPAAEGGASRSSTQSPRAAGVCCRETGAEAAEADVVACAAVVGVDKPLGVLGSFLCFTTHRGSAILDIKFQHEIGQMRSGCVSEEGQKRASCAWHRAGRQVGAGAEVAVAKVWKALAPCSWLSMAVANSIGNRMDN